ncbi:hypothetical protein [Acidithiobacillus ferrooxidans]|jgi:hypothetical protein|uniref:hypothetical protein n=1 Tax=Acidithiobacillus ferrooxidans TaxID=920 RepID=UPI000AB36769|nr:hypothetical protein [Acidithiobacillus ferrooxidans]
MEHDPIQYNQNIDDTLDEHLADDAMADQMMQALHLPPGLDLLFQILDEMSDGIPTPPAEKITPTPYFRTPSLGS